MGCSTHIVPSWSKVAMRSSGGTNFGLLLSVVIFTKSMIDCLAGPSFQDESGLPSATGAVVEAAGLAAGGLGFEEQEKFSPTSSRAGKTNILHFRFVTRPRLLNRS